MIEPGQKGTSKLRFVRRMHEMGQRASQALERIVGSAIGNCAQQQTKRPRNLR